MGMCSLKHDEPDISASRLSRYGSGWHRGHCFVLLVRHKSWWEHSGGKNCSPFLVPGDLHRLVANDSVREHTRWRLQAKRFLEGFSAWVSAMDEDFVMGDHRDCVHWFFLSHWRGVVIQALSRQAFLFSLPASTQFPFALHTPCFTPTRSMQEVDV
jgi:hypothetical protein